MPSPGGFNMPPPMLARRGRSSALPARARWSPLLGRQNRQAKYYALTRRGRAQLRVEAENWRRYAAAVFAALDAPALRP
jgi:hypothetical protein